MNRVIIAVTFMMLSTPALAEAPYVGKWAAADLSCDDEAIVLKERALHTAGNDCTFVKVDVNKTLFSVEAMCQGEGRPQEASSFIIDMAGKNSMVLTHADGIPILYRRCQP